LANELGQSFPCFADGEFHRDEVYKGVQTESNRNGPRTSPRRGIGEILKVPNLRI
jgi:hypothetical protein